MCLGRRDDTIRPQGLIGSISKGMVQGMIFVTSRGQSVDSEKDLTAPERHILQKLFFWEDLAENVEQFRLKVKEAFKRGWNDSGPVTPRPLLLEIIKDLEERVKGRTDRKEKRG